MPFVFLVEDGSGLAGANSYGSVAEFTTYWEGRGKDMTQYLPDQKQSALVQSADHIDLFYGPKFYGFKASSTQALQFPRIYLYDSRCQPVLGVPNALKYAQFEYAYRVITTSKPLVPDPVIDETGLQVQSSFKKVGPLEKRTTFTTQARTTLKPYPKADAYLNEFVSGGGGSHRA